MSAQGNVGSAIWKIDEKELDFLYPSLLFSIHYFKLSVYKSFVLQLLLKEFQKFHVGLFLLYVQFRGIKFYWDKLCLKKNIIKNKAWESRVCLNQRINDNPIHTSKLKISKKVMENYKKFNCSIFIICFSLLLKTPRNHRQSSELTGASVLKFLWASR